MAIAVGTPCWIIESLNWPELIGHVCIVASIGDCGRRHRKIEACVGRVHIIALENTLCLSTWRALRPLLPPTRRQRLDLLRHVRETDEDDREAAVARLREWLLNV